MEKSRDELMGTMPVKQLLLKTALPMMISMLVQALYNIVDSVYVSRVSEEAMSAVSLAFPLQTLMIGVGVGTAVGTNAMLSRHLGERNLDEANRSANTGLLLSLLSWLLFAVIGFAFSRLYFTLITDNKTVVDYGTQYCKVCLVLSVGFLIQNTLERMLPANGYSKFAMICQTSGAITNIILDPVFIFGVPALHIPRLEVLGAAIATVVGQFVSAGVALILVRHKVPQLTLSFDRLKWHTPTVKAIYSIGLPSIIMQCVSSFMNFGMNKILVSFEATAITATAFFGAYYKLQSFIFMPIFGLNSGMIPIVSYNYGAKKTDRLWETVKFTFAIAIGIMSFGTLIFEIMPGTLLGIFKASDTMLKIGCRGLRIIAIHFPIAGFCIIAGSVFQAVGNPTHSVITSICRQLVVLLPASYFLGKLGGLDAIWWAFPLAEIVSFAFSLIFMISTVKSVKEKLMS